jgi:hypothetical protein
MDSEIGLPGKGRAEISGIALIRAPKKWRWVITHTVWPLKVFLCGYEDRFFVLGCAPAIR